MSVLRYRLSDYKPNLKRWDNYVEMQAELRLSARTFTRLGKQTRSKKVYSPRPANNPRY